MKNPFRLWGFLSKCNVAVMLLLVGLMTLGAKAQTDADANAKAEATSEDAPRVVSLVVKTPSATGRLRSDEVDVKLFARRLAHGRMTDEEISLKILSVEPIRSLATGRAASYKVRVEMPAEVNRDDYALLAYIDAGNAVVESDAGAVDLVIAFNKVTLPRRIVSGGKGVARFSVKITNKGDLAVRRKQRVDITIVARQAGVMDDSKDVVLSTAENESLGGLEPGESHRLVLIAEFPGQLDVQSYNLLAKVDTANTITERDESNNSDQLPDTIAVTGQNVDLLCDIADVQLPKGIVAGSTKRLVVPVQISNVGNLGFDLDQTVDIRIVARPAFSATDASEDVLLALLGGQSIAELGPGKVQVIKVPAVIPATLAKGTYTLRVTVDSANRVKEANEHNNTAMLLEPISVLAKVVDLQGELMEARAPKRVIAGQTPRLIMPVRITNSGSVPFGAGSAPIDVKFIARPSDALDTKGDILLKEIKARPISGLKPKQSMILNLDIDLPKQIQPARYRLLVLVDAGDVIGEADETNNAPVYPDLLSVEKPFVDLVAGIVTLRPARPIVSGSTHQLTVPVKVTNRGNVSPSSGPVTIRVSARPISKPNSARNDVTLATLEKIDLSGLAPGTTQMFTAKASFPVRMPGGKYLLVAHVDADAVVKEPDEDNNFAVAPKVHAIQIASPRVDIAAEIVNLDLPRSVIAGQGNVLILPVKVINQGNVPLAADQYVDLKVSARPLGSTGDKDVDLALLIDRPVTGLPPQAAMTFDAKIQIPQNVEAGRYLLTAVIDATDKLAEENEENNRVVTAPAQAFEVVAPEVDLVVDIVNPQLPKAAIAGHGPDAVLPIKITNAGNVAIKATQTIDIKVFARDVQGGEPTLVATLANQSVGGLEPGHDLSVTATARIPEGSPHGSYVWIAQIDTSDLLAETDEKNNEAVTAGANATVVARPFVDLAINVEAPNRPTALIGGHGEPIDLQITITNTGNVAVAKGVKLNADVFCVAKGQDRQTLAQLTEIEVGTLAPGQGRHVSASVRLPATLSAGRYVLGTSLTNAKVASDTNVKNDTASLVAADAITLARPFVDLAISIKALDLPSSLIAGHSKPVSLQLTIMNKGNVAVAKNVKLNAQIFGTSAGKTPQILTELKNIAVGELAPGQSRQVSAEVRFPLTQEAGRYALGAFLLNTQAASDIQEKNNAVQMVDAKAIRLVRPFVDIALALDPVRLPRQAIAGHANEIKLPLRITNQGNVPLAANRQINLHLYAVGLGKEGGRIETGSLDGVPVGSLEPGQSVVAVARIKLPVTLVAGRYQLAAELDPATATGDTDPGNNSVATAAAHAIEIGRPYIDLETTLLSASLPQSVIGGFGPAFELEIRLSNQGNVSVGPQQKIKLTVEAIAVQGGDSIAVASRDGVQVMGLAPGLNTSVKVPVLLPASLKGGRYHLRIKATPLGQLAESTLKNNVITTTESIEVVDPVVDLVAGVDSPAIPATVVAGMGAPVSVSALIRNAGNVPTRLGQKVNVKLFMQSTQKNSGKPIILAAVTGVNLAGLEPSSVESVALTGKISADIAAGTYRLGVLVEPLEALTEPDRANNRYLLGIDNAVEVTRPFVDLAVRFDPTNLPRKLVAGHAAPVIVPVYVTNRGNVPLHASSKVQIQVFARAIDRKAKDILLATLSDQSLGSLSPGGTATFDAQVSFPPAMAVGYYVVGVAVDTAGQVRESNEKNNLSLMDEGLAMAVDRPRVDLFATLETVRPAGGTILSAQKISVYLKVGNRGNVPLSDKQTMDIMLYARPVSLGSLPDMDIKLGRMADLDVSALGPGQIRTFRHAVMFSTASMPTDDYLVVAQIDSSNLIQEVDEANNDASNPDHVIALGRRFRIKSLPVPFDSDGPRRYKVRGIKFKFQGTGKKPPLEQLLALEVGFTQSYAGLVAIRYDEPVKRMSLKQVSNLQDVYLYRSAVRVLCARIADNLKHLGYPGLTVLPAPQHIDRQGEDLRPKGQLGLTIVIQRRK